MCSWYPPVAEGTGLRWVEGHCGFFGGTWQRALCAHGPSKGGDEKGHGWKRKEQLSADRDKEDPMFPFIQLLANFPGGLQCLGVKQIVASGSGRVKWGLFFLLVSQISLQIAGIINSALAIS